MTQRLCSIEGCGGIHYGLDLCQKHYLRQRATGDPLKVRGRTSKPAIDRLNRRLDRSDPEACWPYPGHASRSGHVQIWDGGRMRAVHRVAWEASNGAIPDGMVVCHRCDNPPCCNPLHLFLGTVADNNADRDRKGRQIAPAGSSNGNAKLTEADVVLIREACDGGEPQTSIARRFGVSQSVVSLINLRKSWAHVREEAAS